ncbi:MAG TPA: tRNA(Ile)(2)-agmatinylcytidine synthase [Candidatus Methanofastidiosa archaeon]|nr:tRNA(Ile)(2)-agmatinylcytidine synthase [Candidatus Methanofastidiosa archaeon]
MDDTDSTSGMCTTFLCKMVIDELSPSCSVIDLPRLVRLNPNIPYKTRGNGALSFEIEGDFDKISNKIRDLLLEYRMEGPNTNPGVVIVEDGPNDVLGDFYQKALHEHIDISEARGIIADMGAWSMALGNGRGLIGALASIGADLSDHTYELIAYRMPENIGTPRYVEESSVKDMDRRFYPAIFDSYDWNNRYLAIAPNSPCPVLYGIRGNDREMLEEASKMVVSEPIFKSQIFRTNQATDAHIVKMALSEVKEYMSIRAFGEVTVAPHYEHKGHLFFKMSDGTADIIVAAYEPTKEFRNVVAKLVLGDQIEVWGGVKGTDFGLTLNLEKLLVHRPVRKYENVVPTCCGRKMQSVGKDKGYRCKLCGRKAPLRSIERRMVERDLNRGLYEVPVIARRHLSKPISQF